MPAMYHKKLIHNSIILRSTMFTSFRFRELLSGPAPFAVYAPLAVSCARAKLDTSLAPGV